MGIRLLEITEKAKERPDEPFLDAIEMSKIEQEFVLALLEKFQPVKIVEIGCAAGGTSALILRHTKFHQKVYGIDICPNYYRDPTKNTSYIVEEYCKPDEKSRYSLYLGKDPIYRMEAIGNGIDFVIMDTMHSLPGELLTFFAIYKYLKKGCVLVLHDLTLNFEKFDRSNLAARKNSFCTNVVFSNIGSNTKFLPDIPMPNVGAVLIDDQTEANIESMFMALAYTWAYFPVDLIQPYKQYIDRTYSDFCKSFFSRCVIAQSRLAKGVY